jgi:hypothetical protein
MSLYFKRETLPAPNVLILENPNPNSLTFTFGDETQNTTFATTGNATETFSVSNTGTSLFSVSPTTGTVVNNAGVVLSVTTAENIDSLLGNSAGVVNATITVTLSGGSVKTLIVNYQSNNPADEEGDPGSATDSGGDPGGGTDTAPTDGPGSSGGTDVF